MKNVFDSAGRIITTTTESGGFTNAFDGSGKPIGFSNSVGTFDESGRLVTYTPDQFGLLADRDDEDN